MLGAQQAVVLRATENGCGDPRKVQNFEKKIPRFFRATRCSSLIHPRSHSTRLKALPATYRYRCCFNRGSAQTIGYHQRCVPREHMTRRAPRGQHGTIDRVQEQVLHGGGAFLCCPPTQPLSHLQYSWCTLERVLKSLLFDTPGRQGLRICRFPMRTFQ